MTVPRASAGLLRNHIRHPVHQASTPPIRQFATTRRCFDQNEPRRPTPPPAEGETPQKNWIPMLGAALAAFAGYAYITRPSKDLPTNATQNVEAGVQAAKGTNRSTEN